MWTGLRPALLGASQHWSAKLIGFIPTQNLAATYLSRGGLKTPGRDDNRVCGITSNWKLSGYEVELGTVFEVRSVIAVTRQPPDNSGNGTFVQASQ